MNYLTLIVLLGTSLLGCVAGVMGSFAVLRRRALIGDLLSHAALPGLCLAFIIMGQRHFVGMLAGAFVTGLLGVALITLVCRYTRTKEDAALGIVLSTFFGAGIVLSSIIQHQAGGGAKAGLESYIYGQAVGMGRGDLYVFAGVSAVVLLVVLLLYKEFKLLSFDPGFAQVQGWPVLTLDMTMMGTLALVTVIGLPAVGVVLMAAMLIIPGATARFWTNRLGPLLVLSGVIGALTGALGTMLSAGAAKAWLGFDPPTGPVIVLSGTTLFLFSVAFAPRRGVIARLVVDLRLRLRIGREHLLRTLFELSEPKLPQLPEISMDQLLAHRAFGRLGIRWLIHRAAGRGFVQRSLQGVCLTEAGLTEAWRTVRAHRLWELYLIRGADIAPDHVDRDADTIEHLLTPEIIERLEAELTAEGALPNSPHELADASPAGGPDHA